MNVNEALALANRLRSLVRRANTFGPKSREEILQEICFVADDLEIYADQLDQKMYAEYINGLALEQEKYEDILVSRR